MSDDVFDQMVYADMCKALSIIGMQTLVGQQACADDCQRQEHMLKFFAIMSHEPGRQTLAGLFLFLNWATGNAAAYDMTVCGWPCR